MSTPGGIGVYLDSGPAPANVKDRAWRGVYHHYDGYPDGLGEELIARARRFKGNLGGLVRQVIDSAPRGWSSLQSNEKFGDDGPRVAPDETDNTCWVYLFDVAARRLDVFATHADASGELVGSVSFAADGTATPAKLEIVEPPPKWTRAPIADTWDDSTEQQLALRADVARRVERDCSAAGLTVAGFVELVGHALVETIFQAQWKGRTSPAPLTRVCLPPRWGSDVLWRVKLGDLEVLYPPPGERTPLETRLSGEELLTVALPDLGGAQLDARRSVVARALGGHAQAATNILISALPTIDWVYAFLDLARGTQVPDSLVVKTPAVSQPPWRVFHHADGRAWAIRRGGAGYLLRLGDPKDDPVLKERPSKNADAEIDRLVREQLADGFVAQPDEPA